MMTHISQRREPASVVGIAASIFGNIIIWSIPSLLDMLANACFVKRLQFRTVLIDSWYASMDVMKAIEAVSKVYYAPLKRNRLVSTSAASAYERVEAFAWTHAETTQGKLAHIKKFPKGHQVKVFRIASDSGSTEYIATNDLSQSEVSEAMQQKCRLRWKIEQLHRELKQPRVSGNARVVSIVPNAIILRVVSGFG